MFKTTYTEKLNFSRKAQTGINMTLKANFTIWLLATLLFSLANTSLAASRSNEFFVKSPYTVEILGTYNYYSLESRSPINTTGRDYTEKGTLFGSRATLTYKGVTNNFYAKAAIDYTVDRTKLNGTDRFGVQKNTYVKNDYDRKEMNFGYLFKDSKEIPFVVAVYSGFGTRTRGKKFDNADGYFEEYSWSYIPIGLRADYSYGQRFFGYFDFVARFQHNSEVDMALSNVNAACPDIDITLGDEVGFKGEASISYMHKGAIALTFAPWFEYTETDGSDPFDLGWCTGFPAGTTEIVPTVTNQIGVNLGITFLF